MYKKTTLLLMVLLALAASGYCQIRLPRLLSDGAVLQRGIELKIWGWAAPDEAVTLGFSNNTYRTKADARGNWQIMLPPQKAGGPYEMVLTGSNRVVLHDLLFGEVWLCSGQSNMELTMQRLQDNYPDIVAASENPNIRQFLVPDRYDFRQAHEDLESGAWKAADPENVLEFSGVAYFFARELYERYRVPIGLINAALGGSPVEAWMSEGALKPFPEAYAELQRFKDPNLIQDIEQQDKTRQQNWYAELTRKDLGLTNEPPWFSPAFDDSGWASMAVPNFWADQGAGAVHGVVWFRKKVVVPESMAGKAAKLWLGRIVDQDHVYVNGEYVGTTGYQYPPRKYTVPAGLLKAGENSIAVRVINEQGKGGFILDKPYFLAAGPDTIDLKGAWAYRVGATMEPLGSPTFIRWKPGGLHNSMIAPLLHYKIKGVIWYQGESNTKDPQSYFKTFPALIRNWRAEWQIGDFPFLYVQLANFMEEKTEPAESSWAELRQAQLSTLSVPNTGMAVITDLGEWNDIHPLNKQDVGKRLAQQAFRRAYGEKDTALNPVPDKYKFGKQQVAIQFDYVDTGLMAKNGEPLRGFEVSADGRHFVQAQAEIRGKRVLVWNEQVHNPVAVRYAWADNPGRANLFSKKGLPVTPFEGRK